MIRNKNVILILTLLLVSFITYDLYARGRGGGGHRGGGGNVSRSSPARGGSMHSSRGARGSSGQYNRGNPGRGNVGQPGRGGNVNVNVNKSYYGGGGHRHYNNYNAGAFAAGLVVGTTLSAVAYRSAYPSGCVITYVGNVSYYHCGTTWYQRSYGSGGDTYIVINNPTP